MKKFLAAVLVSAMVFAAFAFADGSRFASKSLEELLGMRSEIDQEIEFRVRDDTAMIFSGTYYCGIDIEPGKYILYADKPTDGCKIYIYTKYSDPNRNSKLEYAVEGESFYLNLEKGDRLELSYVKEARLVKLAAPKWALTDSL